MLWDFLPRYNRKFAVAPAQVGSAYHKPQKVFHPDQVFCFKYYRTVGRDNVVRFGEHRIQIMPSNGRLSYAQARVEVHEKLDGGLAVYYQGHCLATKSAPPEAPILRTRKTALMPNLARSDQLAVPTTAAKPPKPDRYAKPAPDHPWRTPFRVHIDRG